MMRSLFPLFLCAFALPAATPTPEQITAVLKDYCAGCHSGGQAAGRLRLDSLANLARGGGSGFAVVPGDSADSLLIRRIATGDRSLLMPPTGGALDPAKIAMFKEWVDAGAPGLPRSEVARPVKYAADIEPLLRSRCYGCHSGTQPKSQLRLDTRSGALKGGAGGPSIVPGGAEKSRLIHRIEGRGGEQRMPFGGNKLTPDEIALLRTWINRGAEWPAPNEHTPIEKH